MRTLLSILALTELALGLVFPPPGAIIVGPYSRFKKVQAAVDAMPATGGTIFIYPGRYQEQVNVTKPDVTIVGFSADDESYRANRVTITQGLSAPKAGSNDGSGTMIVKATGFKMYNVNLVNSFGKGAQALALSVTPGDPKSVQAFYGCKFDGYQDTILVDSGQQFFVRSMIQGATDFIFGMNGRSWFEKVDIRVKNGGSFITANGRSNTTQESIFVINKSIVMAEPGQEVAQQSYFLGRPWRQASRVVFQRSILSDVINPKGWSVWQTTDQRTGQVQYGEFRNLGPGAIGERANFSRQLIEPVELNTVLPGFETWVDNRFLGFDEFF